VSGIGLIGCGHWGSNHLRVWSELGELRAVCDADADRLERVRHEHPNLPLYGNVASLIADEEVTAVVIATPAATHAELVSHALDAGLDVLVEKPMALHLSEAKELVDQARSCRRLLMVGHVIEFHPAVQKLRSLISKGNLGKIRYLYSNRLNFGKLRTEESALWSFAPHDVAIMLRIVGSMPELVACHGGGYLNQDVADVTLMTLGFSGEVRGHIFVSWLHPFKEHRFVVVGDRQMAVFDDTRPWEEKLTLYPHRVDWLEGRVPVANTADGQLVPLEAEEPLKAECEHFTSCIKERQQPLTDGQSGLRVLSVLHMAQGSLERESRRYELGDHSVQGTFVHPSAVVEEGVRVGEGTKVWHFSHLMSDAEIGRDCVLGQNVFIGSRARIGNLVKIQNNVSIYEGVELEDEVFCGPSVTFTNVSNPRSAIDRKNAFRKTIVERGATLGANSTVVCGCRIGRYAFVGAGATVTRDVPPHCLVVGVPARAVGWVCECGEGIVFDGDVARCGACGLTYRMGESVERCPD
jgi:UDP-2-acetamido-3-amino-2,3-dideoxy-glucuronate N-acetyltransferase